jgi:uncharacterized membrane protein YobD (UPF0266 family)
MEITFHRSFFESICLCVFACILFTVHLITGHHLLFAHYYLAIAGVVSIFIAFKIYAIINSKGITFYYGPSYSREAIFIQWAEISNITIGNADVSWIQSTGARVWISTKVSQEVPALRIIFKTPLPSEMQNKIRDCLGKNMLPPSEAINELGNEIIIKKPPHGGFQRFINIASNITGDDISYEKS